ncbi:MAG: DNA polymerase III subunit alpha [Bifidobacteriaceae bacterium]|jgi:DNA polymerase-3 subunit alpha|nr:DNA polymerase III subunit alpha [Bifidobacteriaceae bacterium]
MSKIFEYSPDDFVHLHAHTDFSKLDGAAKVDNYVQKVFENGQTAAAITDHGYLHGIWDFFKSCANLAQKQGAPSASAGKPWQSGTIGDDWPVRPIMGIEAYLTPGTHRTDKTKVQFGSPGLPGYNPKDDVSASGTYTHITLIAENDIGMNNLIKAASRAGIDTPFSKYPRFDIELLETYHEGLIATSGCASSEINTLLRIGLYDKALESARKFQEIFGKENYYIELMDHGIEFERKTLADLVKLAEAIDAPFVLTNDLHYIGPENASGQEALLCVNSGNKLNDPDRFKFDGAGYYVKTADEMYEVIAAMPHLTDAQKEQAFKNTKKIADRCNISFKPAKLGINPETKKFEATNVFMPQFPLPEGHTNDSYFLELIEQGKKRIYESPDARIPLNDKIQKQIDYETSVILEMGFSGYFIVVADFINWAKTNDIMVGPGRGSAAGSIISYLLGITTLDPLEHKLIFERFLNPERISLPDIDVDFEQGGRNKVIEYCSQRYGVENVAQVSNFAIIKAKQALKDATRVLDLPASIGNKITSIYPQVSIAEMPPLSVVDDENNAYWKKKNFSFSNTKEFLEFMQNDSANIPTPTNAGTASNREILALAKQLEGLVRGSGIHASAVLISPVPLNEVIPTMMRLADDAHVTQLEHHACEELGLVKMDFLGIANLNSMREALANIELLGKEVPDINKIPLDDPNTFALFKRADTLGVFQFDGAGMRDLINRMKPETFEHISATIALFRPGPMGQNTHTKYADRKNGKEKITPIHPEVEQALSEIVSETYGLIVYQEQIQQAGVALANFTLGGADELRRAMGKKDPKALEKQKIPFFAGMKENGYSEEAAQTVWDYFLPFAEYAFNRAHSAAYGLIGYQNAYLKANYPAEFMAGTLTSNNNKPERIALYLSECKKMGIKVLPPDINLSTTSFVPKDDKHIMFSLQGLANVGEAVVHEIIKTREEKGDFKSFFDFINKVPQKVSNKRVVESLIKTGCFDTLHPNSRHALFMIHEEVVNFASKKKLEDQKMGPSLFDLGQTPDVDDLYDFKHFTIPQISEWASEIMLKFEKELMGTYISAHPLDGKTEYFEKQKCYKIAELAGLNGHGLRNGSNVKVGGIITAVNRRTSKNGKEFATLLLEDITGEIEITLFGKSYSDNEFALQKDGYVIINGKCEFAEPTLDANGEADSGGDRPPKLIGFAVEQVNFAKEIANLNLRINPAYASQSNFEKLKEVLMRPEYKGKSPVVLFLFNREKTEDDYQIIMPTETWELPSIMIDISNSELLVEIKALFGLDAIITESELVNYLVKPS